MHKLINYTLILGMITLPLSGKVEKQIEETFNVNPGDQIRFSVDKGSVAIRTGKSDTVTVKVFLTANAVTKIEAINLFKLYETKIYQSGSTVNLDIKKLKKSNGWLSLTDKSKKVKFAVEITVPEIFSIEGKTGSGSIEASGITGFSVMETGSGLIKVRELDGDVSLSTGSGHIELHDCVALIDAATGSGSIKLHNVIGPVKANTGSGSIYADIKGGNFKFATGSGGIEVKMASPLIENSYARTGSGSIRMMLPSDLAAHVELRTSSGSVNSDFEVNSSQKHKRNYVEGTINGGGPELQSQSGSGNILIARL